MKPFIFLALQLLIFLPLTSLAANVGMTPITTSHENTKITTLQKAHLKNSYGKLPLYFIKNNGQVNKDVSFYERGAGHATFFTEDGLVLSLTKKESKADKASFNEDVLGLRTKESAKTTTEAVTLSFIGANARAKISSSDKMSGHVNYFVGNDKSKWQSNIPTYGTVTYKDVYKNIDIKFYGNNKNIEHDVIVRPGGDFSNVKFAYSGIKGLSVRDDGNLEVTLNHGTIIEEKPVIYQEIKGERVLVEGSYKILKSDEGRFTYGFTVASYDKTKDLVIDPVLIYSTYLGGESGDSGVGITVDSAGYAYVTGQAFSFSFPLMNPIQASGSGDDAFITKMNPAGTALIYSTYLGGFGPDVGNAIAVDSVGAVYVTGTTLSGDFPTMNPIQGSLAGFNGQSDAFITKINPAGSALVYSTYLGGGSVEYGNAIAVDSAGAAYITGGTSSPFDFPLMNPIQGALSGSLDAFITKINPAGSALVYSTFLGGSGNDITHGIAVDSAGAAYITGETNALDFPTMNPIQGVNGGNMNQTDAFVTKINPAGSALIYSTYLGGLVSDRGLAIALDGTGAAYVTGDTFSTDFPIVNPLQVIQPTLEAAFVTKINATGAAFVYSTYLGGSSRDTGNGIAIDSAGAAYITGTTGSADFPVVNALQTAIAGANDSFVTKIDSTGSTLVYSTYLGGSLTDAANAIAVDSAGSVYITGTTNSTDFPLMNPVQVVFGGLDDAFVTKIGIAPPPVVTLAVTPDAANILQGFTLGYNVTATNTTAVQQCFQYWENVTLPGGTLFPAKGSLYKPVPRLCLNGGASTTVHLTHSVPPTAALGAYVFNSYVGIFPFNFRIVVDTTSFNFSVTSAP